MEQPYLQVCTLCKYWTLLYAEVGQFVGYSDWVERKSHYILLVGLNPDYDSTPDPQFLNFQPGVTRMCTVITIETDDVVEPRENLFADLSVSISMRVQLDPERTQIDIIDTDSE